MLAQHHPAQLALNHAGGVALARAHGIVAVADRGHLGFEIGHERAQRIDALLRRGLARAHGVVDHLEVIVGRRRRGAQHALLFLHRRRVMAKENREEPDDRADAERCRSEDRCAANGRHHAGAGHRGDIHARQC